MLNFNIKKTALKLTVLLMKVYIYIYAYIYIHTPMYLPENTSFTVKQTKINDQF